MNILQRIRERLHDAIVWNICVRSCSTSPWPDCQKNCYGLCIKLFFISSLHKKIFDRFVRIRKILKKILFCSYIFINYQHVQIQSNIIKNELVLFVGGLKIMSAALVADYKAESPGLDEHLCGPVCHRAVSNSLHAIVATSSQLSRLWVLAGRRWDASVTLFYQQAVTIPQHKIIPLTYAYKLEWLKKRKDTCAKVLLLWSVHRVLFFIVAMQNDIAFLSCLTPKIHIYDH